MLTNHGKGGANALSYMVVDKIFYDAAGRPTAEAKKVGTSLEDSIMRCQYDELGRIALKKLGSSRTSLTNFAYTSNPVDTLTSKSLQLIKIIINLCENHLSIF